MSKNEVEELTEKTVRKGGLLTKLYFDIQSKNESEVQPLMTDLINNKLLKSAGVIYCFGSVDETIKLDDVFSTSAALTVLFVDIGALINVVFNFAPAGIEIIKPENEVVIKTSQLQSVMLSLSEISVDYSKYILERVLKKEELDNIERDLKARAELGKRLLEKSRDNNKGKE
ncbi:MAG: hypothetical protein ACP5M9_04115 [Candidatus Micrarchaeia archaeon]